MRRSVGSSWFSSAVEGLRPIQTMARSPPSKSPAQECRNAYRHVRHGENSQGLPDSYPLMV